jgi:serine/threonine protein kinase
MNIGPYEVVAEIGHGGMGVVYKAKEPRTDRLVAIKMLTGINAQTPDGRMGLVREARTAGELLHPNIVAILDIGQHKGWLYIVMEYLEGFSLELILKSPVHIEPARHVNLAIQVCSGLSYAHTRGIIHRDIKPGNIFVLKNGPIKIVDFGLAKLAEVTGLSLTKSTNTRVAGTPLYMSPEQINGIQVDGRSDIWSLGVTFYQMLASRPPFNGKTLIALIKSIETDPIPPLDGSLKMHEELMRVLRRALAKDRNARYATADAFAEDLRGILCSLNAGELNAEVDQGPVSTGGTIPSCSDQLESKRYAPLNLGFHEKSPVKVRCGTSKFSESGPVEAVKQYLSELDYSWPWRGKSKPGRYEQPSLTLLIALGFISFALIRVIDGPHRVHTWHDFIRDRLSVTIAALALLFAVSIFGIIAPRARRATGTAKRKCRTCFRRMIQVSRWTRFVSTRTEIVVGLSDCMAALREGNFEDAAKLLTVHGTQVPVSYSVIRYNLEFWECRRCLDRSALLIGEDLFDEKWKRRDEFFESYLY